ncbi:Micrococcal nuclease (thermonuclease)-like protein [Candidatus Nitrosarchaeum limnium SFB1]|jgi:micrococcal nuclease|uniref:Micrococcal nuclease (Thermonuclease)-like protein n=1 Tax=Candidatus Nitrosarchaeum limnium SFB1 TaxID=886738 RepID=F3KKH5_9ARCH|nr:Micrococcal nuclease (thermonuclease)-like protein [Candidatus Nitrosarchaeum limnium SFB1]
MILISISIVAIIGVILGLQQLVTWQAQTALDQYTSSSQTEEESTITITKSFVSECTGNARCIKGLVTDVIDGDTIKVDGQYIRFALSSALELNESDGKIAKDLINGICPIGSSVIVDEDDGQTKGSYGRILGVIYCNGENLNEQLLESGYGSMSTEFCSVSEFSNSEWAQKYGC